MGWFGALWRGTGVKTVIGLGGVLVGVLSAILVGVVQDKVAEAGSRNIAIFLAIVLAALIVVITLQIKIFSAVEQMRERRRFSIDYYPGMTPGELLELHRQAGKVIQRAPRDAEIYAVNSYVEVFAGPGAGPGAPEVEASQREYLKQFELKFPTISYHRLIQLRNGQSARGSTPLSRLIMPAYLDHYRKMVQHAHNDPRRAIRIEEVEARLPTSFVLIKNGNGGEIIWQMNQHAPRPDQPDAMTINGIFIVTDPDGLVVRHFMEWFHILDRGRANPLTDDDLRPAP